jgi:hypothetical protein
LPPIAEAEDDLPQLTAVPDNFGSVGEEKSTLEQKPLEPCCLEVYDTDARRGRKGRMRGKGRKGGMRGKGRASRGKRSLVGKAERDKNQKAGGGGVRRNKKKGYSKKLNAVSVVKAAGNSHKKRYNAQGVATKAAESGSKKKHHAQSVATEAEKEAARGEGEKVSLEFKPDPVASESDHAKAVKNKKGVVMDIRVDVRAKKVGHAKKALSDEKDEAHDGDQLNKHRQKKKQGTSRKL